MNAEERAELARKQQINTNISRSHIPRWTADKMRLDEKRFRRRPDNEKGLQAAVDFLEGRINPPLLFLAGPTGVGKTHLAVAVAWDYLEDGLTVQYYQIEDLLNELQSRLDDGQMLARIWARLKDTDLLILDDIGAHNPTPWRTSQLDALVDYRYRECAPTILTSNVTSLPERILDRLKAGRTVVIKGDSWRGKEIDDGNKTGNP